ncbi:MAG: hypothetical protein ABUS57_04625 [Pseudomonadota bacterium]
MHVGLALIALGIHWGVGRLGLPPAFPLQAVSAFSIFGAIEFLFDLYLWRLLCALPFLHLIDVGGDYQGTLLTSGGGQPYNVTAEIRQRWSRMLVHFDSSGVWSTSFSAALPKGRRKHDRFELIYNYVVQTQRDDAGNVVVEGHHGTAMLQVSADGKTLSGQYYTEQDRNSWGKITLTRSAK